MKVKIVVVPVDLCTWINAIKKAAGFPAKAKKVRTCYLWNQPGLAVLHFTHESFDDVPYFYVLNHQTLGRETLEAEHG